MNSDVSINIVSEDEDIQTTNPTSVTFSFGVSNIPTASLELSPDDMYLLCDFEQHRRRAIQIEVTTKQGCIKFNGLTDGLSFNQNVGDVGGQLIIKHEFQQLLETFSRLPGFHPSQVDIMSRVSLLRHDYSSITNYLIGIDVVDAIEMNTENTKPIAYIIKVAKSMLKAQKKLLFAQNVGTFGQNMVQAAATYSQAKFDTAIALLDKIDTRYVDNMYINNAADPRVGQLIFPCITNSSGSIFEFLINALRMFGCNLIIGNETAFVVPDGGFFKFPHDSLPLPTSSNSIKANSFTNIAYPSQFGRVAFNDNGYKDIKTVYVVADPSTLYYSKWASPDLGVYTDPNSRGGLLVVKLPEFCVYNLNAHANVDTSALHDDVASGGPNLQKKVTEEEARANESQQSQKILLDSFNQKQDFFNNWAQLQYFFYKYRDRVGTLSESFNPRWAPGAIGTIYTRKPGIYIDMFVANVSHRISLSAPNSGEAVTSVAFDCGRVSRDPNGLGLDTLTMFDFNYQDSFEFANDFIQSIIP